MPMTTATDLKNHLGAYLDAAFTEPVFVQKSGRDVAVLLSRQQYDALQALEDELWALRAQIAEMNGYLGPEASQQAIQTMQATLPDATEPSPLRDAPRL
jgi:prevent-host-death family protein